MNKAESQTIANLFDGAGYRAIRSPGNADIIVLNTCVVRQSAEDKINGELGLLHEVKRNHPQAHLLVTGCFVDADTAALKKRYPHVDLFFGPGDTETLLQWATEKDDIGCLSRDDLAAYREGSPLHAYVPIIQGCNNFCSYCIVPYRRGRERSRQIPDIVREVESLVGSGTRDVTLLGQNVNSYGHDLDSRISLVHLLEEMNGIEGLSRIRFLTNHPKDMEDRLIEAMSRLNKVCEHVSLPFQAGDDDILKAMRRGYTGGQYLRLVEKIRASIPDIALATDVIVGFPGETAQQFDRTMDILKTVRFDTVHVAIYSPRQGTLAAKEYPDIVPADEKKARLVAIEKLQEEVVSAINARLVGTAVEVLVEGNKKGKWYGRTRTDKLVFFRDAADWQGKTVMVKVTRAGAWSLQGDVSLPEN